MTWNTALAWLLTGGAALGFGAAAFVLARAMWPARLVAEAAAREGAGRPVGAVGSFGQVLVDRLAEANLRAGLVAPEFADRLRRRFVMLGQPHLRAHEFRAWQEIAALFFAAVGLTIALGVNRTPAIALAFAAGGFFLPHLWLRDRIGRRHREILRALPYNLDLLTLSVEAGLDFQAALATVVAKGRQGALTDELGLMVQEIRLGKTREEALRNLAERVDLPQLSSFVSSLIQADRMGTSLGKILRIQSTQMRIERTHRAEKLANEAPVKMLFPLIACIFPTVFFVLFAPIVYQMMHGGVGR